MARFALALVVLVAGCGHEAMAPPPDARPFDAALLDFAVWEPDMGHPFATDGPACDHYDYRQIPIDALELVDSPSSINAGVTQRVKVTFTVHDGCDLLPSAAVAVITHSTVTKLIVQVHAWSAASDCGAARSVERLVPLPLLPIDTSIVVQDGDPMGTAQIAFDRPPAPQGDCTWVLPGDACTLDCQCKNGGDACLTGPNGSFCLYTCQQDTDCWMSGTRCVTDGDLPFTCVLISDNCDCAAPCPFDQHCVDCRCAPSFDTLSCGDCLPGQLVGDQGCFTPCLNSGDCGGSNYCDSARCKEPI
jgi:hypothetical protein